ncbi:hypothetical protein ACH49M_32090 [Rhodococcus qingshengii]|uniref:Uncharacterized protein n=2 Tax=Rhodococcus TaxID=1827 RepID=A0ABV5XFQ8_9NOCA|nr:MULTISPECIES: hypothetical protein [Rhodococcus]EEN86867.1 hypothetical protein RHOER0001_6598 [Rhodococcus erythropolis SK121]MCZ4547871.1 hypothetical protein [Rhodococcus qingshengii]NHP18315.1 hypothetical protein [Rhodococcus sp. IC4_135]UGQ55636.1 hypothetical protein LRL17_32530 [Rhodococcus qingshengii]
MLRTSDVRVGRPADAQYSSTSTAMYTDDLQAGDPRNPAVHEGDVLRARLRLMPCGT